MSETEKPEAEAVDSNALDAPAASADQKVQKPFSLQQSVEALGAAPKHLDYKQILLFDTAVSSKNLGDQVIMGSTKSLLRFIFSSLLIRECADARI